MKSPASEQPRCLILLCERVERVCACGHVGPVLARLPCEIVGDDRETELGRCREARRAEQYAGHYDLFALPFLLGLALYLVDQCAHMAVCFDFSMKYLALITAWRDFKSIRSG